MIEHTGPPTPDHDADAADEDDTVIVGGRDDEATVIVTRDDVDVDDNDDNDDDETVIVAKVRLAGDDEDDDEDTVSVPERRSEPAPVPVIDEEVTVRVERGSSELPTVQVSRNISGAARRSMEPQQGRRRGELRPAPVPSGFGGMPFVASGAGVVSSYRARTLVPPSAQLSAPSSSPAPDRMLGSVLSVREQSKLASRWTIAAVALSIVAIVGAMLWVIKDLVGI